MEMSSQQGGEDVNEASSQPKSIASDVIIEPIAESVKQDNDVVNHQVVEPMSRGNGNETATAAASDNLTRDDNISDSKCWWCCLGLCGCCTACCACLLFIPCLALTLLFNCFMCPLNTAVACCCPSKAQPITIHIDDFQSMFS